MLGYIITGKERRTYDTEVCGVPFAVAELPAGKGWIARRRRERGLRELARRGVRRGIVPEDWQFCAAAWGIRRVEEGILRQELLPELLAVWGQPLRQATVRLRAQRADEAVYRAAELLARQARYVAVQVEEGGEALQAHLYWRLGVGCGGGVPTAEISFTAPTGDVPTLLVGADCAKRQQVEWSLSEEWRQQLPWELTGPLLAALFQEGKLPREAISIKSVGPNA